MKKFTLSGLLLFGLFSLSIISKAQDLRTQNQRVDRHRCSTMEMLEEAIKKDPTLVDKWAKEGERQWNNYLQRQQQDGSLLRTQANEIVIPIVFHIVDVAGVQANITDREIYEQVEQLNRDYSGAKMNAYQNVIPAQIAQRVGRVPVRFVLARRTPAGVLTSGIERRTGATPSRTNIKSTAAGGLDAWDVNKYLNVWCGTFSGADDGLLGIATFPFTTTEGPQGVVIGSYTLSLTNTTRPYYTNYSEGATLPHEIGHYLYLWHAFGDQNACNNADFRLQASWPLPNGAGPEGDDTPEEKGGPGNIIFGNPSMNYSDGCASTSFGMMYGNYMNYFDDRALFMFSDGQRKRVEGCINAYRPGLKTSDGATPPVPVTDAFLVTANPRGTVERVSHVVANTPLRATVRNLGTTTLTSVTVNVQIGAGAPTSTTFPVNLAAGNDTTLNVGTISTTGSYVITMYTSAPNGGTDAFLHNDTLRNFVTVSSSTITAPFSETFTAATFPPANWQVWNPNGGATSTWVRNTASGATAAGSAYVNNFGINQSGTLDELVTPAIDFATNDSSLLTFRVAHGVYDVVDVSAWDGLEVYVSGDGGRNYTLAYKKTGNQLKTITAAQTTSFTATPAQADRWRLETVNLSPYMVAGQKMYIKFRNTNAFGNNILIDDINVSATVKPQIELSVESLSNVLDFTCGNSITPSVTVKNLGLGTITNFRITYFVDNAAPVSTTNNSTLTSGQSLTVALPAIALTPGTHVLTVVANLPNGAADPNALNDTIRKSFVVFPTVNAPLVQNFEASSNLPNGWAAINPDASRTWTVTTQASRPRDASDKASIYMHNFGYAGSNKIDDLFTPKINVTDADSVWAKFDIAAATFNYPGATALNEDTLEVLLTKDCGATFQSVYKKFGTDLQTLRSPNVPVDVEFIPTFNSAWRTDSIYLTPYVGSNGTFQLVFRNKHNSLGNNIYLDNINVFGETLPTVLKQNGYLISPVATTSNFSIWHYNQPTNLRGINVYNSVGQLIWSKQYGGNADRMIWIDLAGKPAGVYFVNLRYTDSNRNTVDRVIKF